MLPRVRPNTCSHVCTVKPVVLALLSALSSVALTAQAADALIGLGMFGTGTSSEARAISANGKVAVGQSATTVSGDIRAFTWTETGGKVNLGVLRDGTASAALGVNWDGSVVVGYSNTTDGYYHAFRWTAANGMVDLGTLGTGNNSYAYAVSTDGNVVVGSSETTVGGNYYAFRWTQAGNMQNLGALPGGVDSTAYGVNRDGSVVVGDSSTTSIGSGDHRAFRWTQAGMVDLGVLPGGNNSSAYAVSADGSVVVGRSATSGTTGYHAFRWTQAGSMVDLGLLAGSTFSYALAVNADGNVVVGVSGNHAFRWTQATSMISVQQWLNDAGVSTAGFQRLKSAYGVSADGNSVVGVGVNAVGRNEAFIARVGATEYSPSGSSGIVGLTDLANSITQTLAVSSQVERLSALMLTGAHQRPLTDMAVADQRGCAWVNGDLGRVYRSGNGYTGIAEMGACHDWSEQGIRVGAGIGHIFSNLSLANNGNSRLQGQYGLAEIDWQVPNQPLLFSALGIYGKWDANLRRGYAIAGTQPSHGETDVNVYILRTRLDWQDAFQLGATSVSPRIAYTVILSEVDAYQEQGGSAPARFNDQNHNARELRLGLTGKTPLNEKTLFLSHAEVAHRFDERGAPIVGSIDALGVGIGFAQPGNSVKQNWARLGAEIDYRLSDKSTINASGFYASAGQDNDISASVSYRLAF